MKKNNRLFATTLVTLALFGAGVMAASPQMPPPGAGPFPYSDYDGNSDGRVSPDEFYAARDARMASRAAGGRMMRNQGNMPAFETFDTNGDGFLSQDEMAAGHAARMQQRQTMMPQGRPMMQQNMPMMQRNMPMMQPNPAMMQPMPRGRGGGPQGGRGQQVIDYGAFDSNQDNRVSPDEFYAGRDARIADRVKEGRMMRNLANMPGFEDFDTDGDGYLSQNEMATGHAVRMQQHRAMMQQQMPRGPAGGGRRGGGGRTPGSFSDFDRDGDGVITEAEFSATQAERQGQRGRRW